MIGRWDEISVRGAHENRPASGSFTAFNIDQSVTHEPDVRAGVDPARRQSLVDGIGSRLVAGGILRPDQAAKERRQPK